MTMILVVFLLTGVNPLKYRSKDGMKTSQTIIGGFLS